MTQRLNFIFCEIRASFCSLVVKLSAAEIVAEIAEAATRDFVIQFGQYVTGTLILLVTVSWWVIASGIEFLLPDVSIILFRFSYADVIKLAVEEVRMWNTTPMTFKRHDHLSFTEDDFVREDTFFFILLLMP